VDNTGDFAVQPHFMVTTGNGESLWWKVLQGPSSIGAHAAATYRIQAPGKGFTVPGKGVRVRLRAFTESPLTLSSQDLRLAPQKDPASHGK
jgi:hypothetical protein